MATIHRQSPYRQTKSDYLLRLVETDSRSIRTTRRQGQPTTTYTTDIHNTDHQQQRINKSINNLPTRRWTTPNFQMPNFHRTEPEEIQMTTRNSGLCFNCLNKDHRIVNCPTKKICQHNDCNKRHNTLLHRDFQIAGNLSHLTGRQGFRTNNRNHPPETSHNKSPSQKEKTASVHVTQKDSTNNCLQKNTEAENYRTETHQPAANL